MTDLSTISGRWDVVVVGAGPAGSAAAISAARKGLEVLQVEAKAFPRRKVCGGCLNQVSVKLLQELVGCESSVWGRAKPLTHFSLMDHQRQFDFSTPSGLVIDRSVLDAAMVEAGKQGGVKFLARVTATLGESEKRCRTVVLRAGASTRTIRSKVVVLATGLGGHRGAENQLQQTPQGRSRVGIEGLIQNLDLGVGDETIQMAIGRDGYVGLTKISERETHLAAAVDRTALREFGPQAAVQRILLESGVNRRLGEKVTWRGTPALTTRAKRLGAPRVFLVGDAANYVEPFTGEGILWALKSGLGVASLLPSAVENWDDGLIKEWETWHQSNIQSKQKLCRQIAFGLKHPSLLWLAHQVLRIQPRFAHQVIRRLNSP